MINILLTAVNAKYIHSNLAVYSLAAYAKKHGRCVDIAEFTINMQVEEVLREIYVRNPEVLLVSCYIWNIEFVKELLVEFNKLCPEVPIWLGGPEVSFMAEAFLTQNPYVTGIMTGEGERSFYELCRAYDNINHAEDIDSMLVEINGIVWRGKDGGINVNPENDFMEMDELAFCYENISDFENRVIYYETSRGCPFSCSYCLSSVDKRVRFRSLSKVFKELQFFLDNKVPQVKFVDRTFNCNHERTVQIWQYIYEHDNGVTNFHFEVSLDLLNDEELKLLAKMRRGLVQLEIGVQTTNCNTLSEIRRNMDLKKLKNIFENIKANGNVHKHLDLIAGLPYEDYASFKKSFDEIYKMKGEQLQLGFLKVLKGSYMYEMAQSYGLIYTDKPPYEVLATRWLTFDELLDIKIVENMLEIHYNSGQFLTALAILETEFESPFEMYLELGKYYRKTGHVNSGYTRVKRTEIFYDFSVIVSEGHNELYKEALLHDLYKRERSKAKPWWAKDEADKMPSRILRKHGLDHRYCRLQKYHYEVWNINPYGCIRECNDIRHYDEPVWILYDYENNDVRVIENE